MRRCVWMAVLLGPVLWTSAGAAAGDTLASRGTGWFAGIGPRYQMLAGDGYNVPQSALRRGGIGGELHLGYGLTPRLSGRVVVSLNEHSGGVSWAAFDALFSWPFGAADPYLFLRLGKQAAVLSSTDFSGMDEEAVGGEWKGWLYGGGGGARWWISPHVCLGADGSYTCVALNRLTRGGFSEPLDRTYDGATWGVGVRIEYHW